MVVDPEDNKTVILKAGIFTDDIERVSGFSPVLGNDIAYAEWDTEYSEEPLDYIKNLRTR